MDDKDKQNISPEYHHGISLPNTTVVNLQAPNTRAYTQPAVLQSLTPPILRPVYQPSHSPGLFTNEFNVLYDNSSPKDVPLPLNSQQATNISNLRTVPSSLIPSGPAGTTPRFEDSTAKVPGRSNDKSGPTKKGKGARSGKNARKSGISDTEIQALDENIKLEADVAFAVPARWDDDEALKLVEFITSPEKWDKVTTSLNKLCQEASQVLFNNKFTVTQCVNKWQSIFRLYKATKKYLNHTGGGDGDQDAEIDEVDEEGRKRNIKKGTGLSYTPLTMETFCEGPLYPLILRVADGRADIDRPVEFSSHRKPEDIDEDLKKLNKKRKKFEADDLSEVLSDALMSVKAQRVEAARHEHERFTYQKQRDDRQERQETERLKLDRERMEIERQAAELHQKRERYELRNSKLEQYRQLRDSADPVESELAKKLAEEIREL